MEIESEPKAFESVVDILMAEKGVQLEGLNALVNATSLDGYNKQYSPAEFDAKMSGRAQVCQYFFRRLGAAFGMEEEGGGLAHIYFLSRFPGDLENYPNLERLYHQIH